MDANLKTKWVEALRSDRFEQARRELQSCDGGSYCCLGVLCVVAEIDLGNIDAAYRRLEKLVGNYDPLVDLNDIKGKSFADIADYIEANL